MRLAFRIPRAFELVRGYLVDHATGLKTNRANVELDTLVELHSDRVARDKEKILFHHAILQEREDISIAIERCRAKEQEKVERRSASAGRSSVDILRDAPLADAHFNSRGNLTLDYRGSSRSRSHGR